MKYLSIAETRAAVLVAIRGPSGAKREIYCPENTTGYAVTGPFAKSHNDHEIVTDARGQQPDETPVGIL
ncbi:hypothetical protein GCM10025779_31650 [Arthrobacter cryoconiti]